MTDEELPRFFRSPPPWPYVLLVAPEACTPEPATLSDLALLVAALTEAQRVKVFGQLEEWRCAARAVRARAEAERERDEALALLRDHISGGCHGLWKRTNALLARGEAGRDGEDGAVRGGEGEMP